VQEETPARDPVPEARLRRRAFLLRISWAGIWTFLGALTVASVRFFFPRVLYEAKPQFRAGYPREYQPGTVSLRFLKSHRVWIVREGDEIYALFAECTHLGCTPIWLGTGRKFKCPCHGSGFTRDGLNFEGPAPRPLERVKLTLGPDGRILVDRSVRFREERGEWTKQGAVLRL